ncbi:hypothetical protein LSTR_LSTR000666 [Laodelphax striatellus]|uniref:Uncharacterized protein n=1 Tax=Laodelphax striatellus TaxID=195883 RepID=A0A482XG60_LAOST|nr:hypothetical protein LSTR_LSTR000666 [Laodelphax striatellus]
MKVIVAVCLMVSVASAAVLVRTPSLDSAVIQSDRLGGNFAYSHVEAPAYTAVNPVITHVPTPVAVSYNHVPVAVPVQVPVVAPAALPAYYAPSAPVFASPAAFFPGSPLPAIPAAPAPAAPETDSSAAPAPAPASEDSPAAAPSSDESESVSVEAAA